MLEQLEEVDGVQAAMANHAGSLVRISLKEHANTGSVASELEAILKKEGRKPKALTDSEIATAIESEQWRKAESVNELSEIEFRTVFERRIQQFVVDEELTDDTKTKLIGFASQVLDETPKSQSDTDWKEFCGGMASRMLDKAKDILSDEQLNKLGERLKSGVSG